MVAKTAARSASFRLENDNFWHRDLMVDSKRFDWCDINKNRVFFGGSSSSLRSALPELLFKSSAESIIIILLPPSVIDREQ